MSKQFLVIKTTNANGTIIVEKDLHSDAFVNFIYNIEREREYRKGTGSRVVAKANGYKVFYTVDGERWSTVYEIVEVENTNDNKCKELLKDVESFVHDNERVTHIVSCFMANGREYCKAKVKNHIEKVYSYADIYNAQDTFVKKVKDYSAPFNIEVDHLVSTQQVTLTLLNTDNDRLELLKVINTALTNNKIVHKVYSDKRMLFTVQLEFSLLSKALNVIDEAITKNTYLTLLHKTDVERTKIGDYIVDRSIMLFGK